MRKKCNNVYTIYTVAFDSPFKGDYYYYIRDGGDTDYTELLRAILNLYSIRQDNTKKILVHCVGYSRSTIVVAGYLMRKYKMKTHNAIDFIKTKRDIGNNPNPGLVELLLNSKELNK